MRSVLMSHVSVRVQTAERLHSCSLPSEKDAGRLVALNFLLLTNENDDVKPHLHHRSRMRVQLSHFSIHLARGLLCLLEYTIPVPLASSATSPRKRLESSPS